MLIVLNIILYVYTLCIYINLLCRYLPVYMQLNVSILSLDDQILHFNNISYLYNQKCTDETKNRIVGLLISIYINIYIHNKK